MKKLLLFLALLPLSMFALENPLSFLQGQSKLDLSISYAEGSLCSMQEDEFIPFMESEADEPWVNITREWKVQFTNELNEELEGHQFLVGSFPKAAYEAVVNVEYLNKKGRFVSTVDFVEKESGTVVYSKYIAADGGVFGSITNLIGDGHKHAGEALGKYLANYVR